MVRLVLGMVLSGWGLLQGAYLWMWCGRPGEALATAVIWGLAGVLVAPLAEDVGDLCRLLIERKDK